ncbi:radical SAM family heme chaperone HemW [Helicobacter vulpis]|uniref:radical SAM family heme chaperone HemW n=1 Tax=Helicobacter vulpis TaxID=2316076 RepID=UPI000EADD130|nr:radical SAM family heme chaperone HemW [Helicobacter vulpis]
MLKTSHTPPKSLYIHVPFCQSKCGYCAFNSFSGLDVLQDSYVKALCQDISASLKGGCLESIFVGGGTPNTLTIRHYAEIFDTIAKHAYLSPHIEITLEANPDLVSLEWCNALKSFGMTRLSIGVQSFLESKLRFLQRDHSCANVYRALDFARQSGIAHLSIDLIYNTPLDTPQSLEQEVAQASALPIDHLSAYSLTLEDNTRLADTSLEILPRLDAHMKACLGMKGFIQYEVSNYARDYQCLHNLGYWQGLEYMGCGAGAVGRVGQTRLYKLKDVRSYIANPIHARLEQLRIEDMNFEAVFLGLRCTLGVNTALLAPEKVKTLLEEKVCYLQRDRLVARDFFLADEIALWLSH